jgi:hypothetical protein
MFPARKRIVHLHLGSKVIRTTVDHPLYVEGKGWVNAGDMPGAKCESEQEVVHNPGEKPMPNFPFIGFVAGTKIMTARGPVSIEDLKPGDMIQVQPADDQGDDKHEAQDDEPGWWESN